MLNLNKQLNQKNFTLKPNKLMKSMLPALCISTFSYSAQAAVVNMTFEDDLKDIKIAWDAVLDVNHIGYNLYRADSVDGAGTLINDESLVSGTMTRFSNAGAGKQYYFYVNSVDVDGNVLDTSTRTAYALVDTDGDGMNDDWENSYDLDSSINDSTIDLDVDGLTNFEEYNSTFAIKPNYADSDGDGIDDGYESNYDGIADPVATEDFAPHDPSVPDSDLDVDGDGFSNLAEYIAGSSPINTAKTPDNLGGITSITQAFTASDDAWLKVGVAGLQDNNLNFLQVKQGVWSALVKFPVNIPDDATITNATLSLTAVGSFSVSISESSNLLLDGSAQWTDETIDGVTVPTRGSEIVQMDLKTAAPIFADVTAAVTSSGTLSFDIQNITENKKKIYSIEAANDPLTAEFVPSLSVTYTSGAVDLPPATVENFTATQAISTINLTWDAGMDADLASYNIYRRANANFLFGAPIGNTSAGTTAFTDATANVDQYYQYIIKAVDNGGNESNDSAVLNIENVTGSGVTTDPKPITVDHIFAADNTSGIKIAWEESNDTDLAGYNVYRDNVLITINEDGSQALVKNTLSNYTDYTAEVNISYQYRVEAVDEASQTSDISEVISYSLIDSDSDGMSDHFEEKYTALINDVPYDVTDPLGDADSDGLNNLAEYTAVTDPTNADTDSDGMPDGFEVNNSLNPNSDKDADWIEGKGDDALIDPDGDGDSNLAEYHAKSDVSDPKSNVMNPNGVEQFYATINPLADTYVTSRYKDKNFYTITSEDENIEDVAVNFNDATELSVSTGNKYLNDEGVEVSTLQYAYLKFDVSQIDMMEGSPLRTMLRIHRTGNSTNDIAIYKVNDSTWNSAALTWNTKPLHGELLASNISLPGNTQTDGVFDEAEHQYAEIDVSAAIIKGENVSFAITRLDDIDKGRSIDSLESAFKPELIITYTKVSMDLDFDGLPDFWERRYGLALGTDNALEDPDGDGLSNLEEYELDLDPSSKDSDNDGISDNVEIENGTNPAIRDDFYAPVFDANEVIISVDATGSLTDITDAVMAQQANFLAYDDFDGLYKSAQISENEDVLLASGRHTIIVEATDASGLFTYKNINVHIKPQANLGLDLIAESGSEILIPITLSGTAANYPATVDYQVMVNEEVTTGQVIFTQDTISANIVLTISDDAQQGDVLVVSFTEATNAVIDEKSALLVNISNDNFKPMVEINVMQANTLISAISPTSGLVTVTADVSDININNRHSITFESIDGVLIDDNSDALLNTFTFDPTTLDTGNYQLKVTIAETNTVELFTIEVLTQIHIDATLTQVLADSDQDGIPDVLDTNDNPSLLSVAEGELPLAVAPGLKLSLGDYAQGNNSASIPKEQLEIDKEFDPVSTVTNFKVEGLQLVGDSVTLVLPLAKGVIIPKGAAYRKYTQIKGWFDFVQDDKNSIGSAIKDIDGICPAPNSSNYLAEDLITANGLVEGKECIQLTIEDGGANDADNVANGIVVDPGVLVMDHVNLAPVITVNDVMAIGNALVTVSASSTDYEGDAISFSWVQLAGPSVAIEGATSNTITFTAPNVLEDTTLLFEVIASDGIESSPQTVKVSVSADPANSNKDSGGSFGWLLSLIALTGLSRTRIFKK